VSDADGGDLDGVRIIFFWNDHPPPHSYVEFSGHRAQFSLETLDVLEGSLPAAKLAAIKAWAQGRRKELTQCRDKARNNLNPGKVV
jgi:hypothetical protein